MLRINIILIGKDKDAWVTQGCAHYEKLLSRYAKLKWLVIIPPKNISSLSPNEIKVKEEELILDKLLKGSTIALTNAGKDYNSKEFSLLLEKLHTTSGGTINLIIGGAYGLDKAVLDRADMSISLSPLTFSHQLVRLVLLEQLYRAFTIIQGTDYHK